jgi:hypothetical protein
MWPIFAGKTPHTAAKTQISQVFSQFFSSKIVKIHCTKTHHFAHILANIHQNFTACILQRSNLYTPTRAGIIQVEG